MKDVENFIRQSVENFLFSEYHRIKNNFENVSDLEKDFSSNFKSWDISDCSIVGSTKLLLWYVASIENQDPYRNDEYKELIESIK